MERMTAGISRPVHAMARLVDVVSSRRLGPAEQDEVARHLRSSSEQTLFWDQPIPDQRHAVAAARVVGEMCSGRPDLIRAALFHDIGKRHARLGVFGRVRAAMSWATGPRTSARVLAYLDHGRLGASDLEALGAEPLVVAFALHHHGQRPGSISAEDWLVLQSADRARLPSPAGAVDRGRTSFPSRRSSHAGRMPTAAAGAEFDRPFPPSGG